MTNNTTESLQLSSEEISRNPQFNNSSVRFTSRSDSRPDEYVCNAVDFVLHTVLQAIFLVCGLAGNSLSMFIFAKMKPRAPTALLLIWLGVCDNVVLVFYSLITGVTPICRLYSVCPYFLDVTLPILKTVVWPVGTMASMAATLLVVCLSYHRFIGACYPHQSARFANIRIARYQVAVIIGSVIVFNIPRFLDDFAYLAPNSTEMIMKSTALGKDPFYQLVYGVIIYYLVAFFVPFVLLIFMTYKLIASLRNFYRNRDHATGTSRDEVAVTRTLVIIVIMFMIVQVLNPIRRLLVAVLPESDTKCGSFYYYFNILSTLGVSFEASIHFALYCLFDKRFRRQLKHWVRSSWSTSVITPTI